MLEEMIVSFVEKRKKIYGGIVGFVLAILLLEYGLVKTCFVVLMTYIGYKIVDSQIVRKIKKKLIERLQD